MRIYLDDVRKPGNSMYGPYDYVVWSYNSFVDFCETFGCPNFISFDHDLGNRPMDTRTGMDCAKYLVMKDIGMNGNFIPTDFDFVVHSSNPVGSMNIQSYLSQYLDKRASNLETGIWDFTLKDGLEE